MSKVSQLGFTPIRCAWFNAREEVDNSSPGRSAREHAKAGSSTTTPEQGVLLPYDSVSILHFAIGSGVLVATILTASDSIAIIPSTNSYLALAVRVLGMWLSVLIQWVLVITGVLNLVRLLLRGLTLNETGLAIPLTRERLCWESIVGFTCERRPVISKILMLKEPAIRLRIISRSRDKRGRIKVRSLDSLFFKATDFETMTRIIGAEAVGLHLDSIEVCAQRETGRPEIAKQSKKERAKSWLFSVYIAVILVCFSGRTALRNYYCNLGTRQLNQYRYAEAKQSFKQSILLDSTYPYSFDRLARIEYRQKNLKDAERLWTIALKRKPDLVSAKVGLSGVYIQRKEWKKAEEILKKSIWLEPQDVPANMNLAYLYIEIEREEEALVLIKQLRNLVPESDAIKALEARALTRMAGKEKEN